jgi:GntR family transcriptional regulator, transcriptional repressor for pyruvate dehydrogenase complex
MATRLREIKKESLPTRVAASIRHDIVGGRFQPGDKLPTEAELSRSLGVSRNVVREAVAQLRSEGLVTSRQGVGAFIVEPETLPVLRINSADLTAAEQYRSLIELRLILETEAAALAAVRHSPEDLELIEEAMAAMNASDVWSEDGVDQDIVFHRAVAAAAGNGFILAFIAFVAAHLKDSIAVARRLSPSHALHVVTLQEHEAVLSAIRAGDARKARTAMRTHITNAARRLGL